MEKITLTLTPEEAKRVLRAVKARENHWSNPEMYKRYENAASVRKTYRDTGCESLISVDSVQLSELGRNEH